MQNKLSTNIKKHGSILASIGCIAIAIAFGYSNILLTIRSILIFMFAASGISFLAAWIDNEDGFNTLGVLLLFFAFLLLIIYFV